MNKEQKESLDSEEEEEEEDTESSTYEIPEGTLVGNFEIIEMIGGGGYGDIYEVKDPKTEIHYAMKIEYLDAEKRGISTEIKILKELQSSHSFPTFIESGKFEDFKYLVMELLGPSLSLLRRSVPTKKLSSFTYLTLGSGMINCIRDLHKLGFIHRDIKPGNFLVRPDKENPICLIDFGLSRSYIDPETGQHKPPREDPGYTGTVRYASLHAHDEFELSRRDDMISWFYSMVELAKGKLPWPGSDDKEETIRLKRTMTIEEICTEMPPEFISIYDHIINLKYEQAPNYDLIITYLNKALSRENIDKSLMDWENLDSEEIHDISSIPLKSKKVEKVEEEDRKKPPSSESSKGVDGKGGCCTIC